MAVCVEGRKRGELGVIAGVVILAGLVDFWRREDAGSIFTPDRKNDGCLRRLDIG